MPPIRPRVPPSQWDQVYGNNDGQLSLDERGVALTAETVFEKHPELKVDIRTELNRDFMSPFRAGATYRDASGATNVRIYPGAVGASSNLVPYIVGHELGHVALNHLDQVGTTGGKTLELEAEWFAGRTLAQFGEDLEMVIAELTAQGGNAASHGDIAERVAAIRGGHAEALAEMQGQPPRRVDPPAPVAPPVIAAPARPAVPPSASDRVSPSSTGSLGGVSPAAANGLENPTAPVVTSAPRDPSVRAAADRLEGAITDWLASLDRVR